MNTTAEGGGAADFLPYAQPDIGEAEVQAVAEVLRSGWLTTGPTAAAFESEFSDFVGGGVHAIAVNSATAGLHLALEALGIQPGDEVIVPTWTFTATAEVVRYLGAIPVIVDVDPQTLNIDLEAMRSAITTRTKAVIVVHFAGLSVNMPDLREALLGSDIKIIEDAAHALPCSAGRIMVGSTDLSDVAVFSFYANKTITTGEGGMVTTRDQRIADRIRVMRLHGIDRDVFDRYQSTRPAWFYDVVAPGFKYNLSDPAAAIGRVQLTRADELRNRRTAIAAQYLEAFAAIPATLPFAGHDTDVHSWHLFVLRLEAAAPVDRDELVSSLSQCGIGTSVHFIPLHRLSYWRTSLDLDPARFPAAEAAYTQAISLPIYSRMSGPDVERVCSEVVRILGK